jgi:hypothetical protein
LPHSFVTARARDFCFITSFFEVRDLFVWLLHEIISWFSDCKRKFISIRPLLQAAQYEENSLKSLRNWPSGSHTSIMPKSTIGHNPEPVPSTSHFHKVMFKLPIHYFLVLLNYPSHWFP